MNVSEDRPEATETLTARELADLAGTTVRTIHYYASEGLLPAPGGSKRDASYSVAHLARLQLIGALREEGLSLAGIRVRLAPLSDRQALEVVEALDRHRATSVTGVLSPLTLVDAAIGPQVVGVAHDARRDAVQPRAAPGSSQTTPVPAMATAGQPLPDASMRALDSASDYLDRVRKQRPTGRVSLPSQPPQPAPAPKPEPIVRPEAWYHFRVADGVELRVREDRFYRTKGRLHAVVESVRATMQRYGMLDHDSPDDPAARRK